MDETERDVAEADDDAVREAPPSRARAWFERNRKRLSRLALLVFVIAVAVEVGRAFPREVNVAFRFPEHASVVEARVEYSQDHEPVREVTLRWPSGAPALVRDDVDLSPGDYDVSVLLIDGTGSTTALRGELAAPADGVVRVRLRE